MNNCYSHINISICRKILPSLSHEFEDRQISRCGSTESEDGFNVCWYSVVIENADVRQFASTEAEDTGDPWCVV